MISLKRKKKTMRHRMVKQSQLRLTKSQLKMMTCWTRSTMIMKVRDV